VANLSELEPWLQPYAKAFLNYLDYLRESPRITSVFRSGRQQALLYERYRRGQSRLPAAPPGRSYHQYRRAMDVVTRHPELAGSIWKQMGGRWWASDPVHFEV
jgi:hypothetical protein